MSGGNNGGGKNGEKMQSPAGFRISYQFIGLMVSVLTTFLLISSEIRQTNDAAEKRAKSFEKGIDDRFREFGRRVEAIPLIQRDISEIRAKLAESARKESVDLQHRALETRLKALEAQWRKSQSASSGTGDGK